MPLQEALLSTNTLYSVRADINKIAEQICSYVKKILSDIFSEDVLIPGLLNFVRDFVWTFVSYDLLNARLQQTEDSTFDAKGQWFSQQLYSTIAMFFTLIAMEIFYRIKKPSDANNETKEFPFILATIYLLAASIAIYVWDRAQVLGINVAQNKLKLSENNSSLFASLFTGIEGFSQYFVVALLRIVNEGHFVDMQEDPRYYLRELMPRVGCSLTFGWLPGWSWQFVYALCSNNNNGAVPTSFAVAFTVAFFNYMSVKLSLLFLNRSVATENSVDDAISIVVSEDNAEINNQPAQSPEITNETMIFSEKKPEEEEQAVPETISPKNNLLRTESSVKSFGDLKRANTSGLLKQQSGDHILPPRIESQLKKKLSSLRRTLDPDKLIIPDPMDPDFGPVVLEKNSSSGLYSTFHSPQKMESPKPAEATTTVNNPAVR